jgi:tRNA nucleotidyltransferase/poly(A) polymerase
MARLLEEYYKILRAGSSEKAFRGLADVGLLEPISTELHVGANDPLWRSLAALDAYRRRFDSTPETLTNAILLGSLLIPLGISLHPPRPPIVRPGTEAGRSGDGDSSAPTPSPNRPPRHPPNPRLGDLPLARRDIERLRQIISLQRRLKDVSASQRGQRALAHRHIFRDALTWMEIHGGSPEIVDHWKAVLADSSPADAPPAEAAGENAPPSGRRRRRRRGRRSRPPQGH